MLLADSMPRNAPADGPRAERHMHSVRERSRQSSEFANEWADAIALQRAERCGVG
jgi:hypothetical protein